MPYLSQPELAIILEIIALLWLIAASLALYVSIQNGRKAREIRERRAIQGEIKYVDDGKPRMLRSDRLGLQGRPDYILEVEGDMVPVELKSGRTPKGPLFSHILQLAAYSVLLEDEGEKVTHGILRYEEAEHEIEYNQDLRRMVVSKLDEMRVLMKNGEVHRNHHRPKCRLAPDVRVVLSAWPDHPPLRFGQVLGLSMEHPFLFAT
jgi:CRISPR-associated exonuclease Cas4